MRTDKTEARLKALLKQGLNKRCINCDSLGPQYVVSSFNVFVCTVCSGVHRQFGHRVKGVSMSTFKPEEVTTLEESGNGKFAAFFLNKWTTSALLKPVDRDVYRINTWITAVYQDRRFYAEPPGGWTPGSSVVMAAGSSTSEGCEPAMRPMSDVLGSDTPKLKVQGSGGLERIISAVSSTAAGTGTPTKPVPAAAAAVFGSLNLMDVSSPKSAQSAPLPAAPTPAPAWGPFGAAAWSSPAASAGAAPAQASPRPTSAPAAEATWASFGDTPAQQPALAAATPAPSAHAAAAPAAEGAGGWEAFGDGPAAPHAAASPAAPANDSPPKVQQPKQPVRSTSRPEVPMDVFYPEFEKIRATGMLPTGQPVPLPSFPHSYGGGTGMQGAPGTHPYATCSYPAGATQPAYGGGYSAAALGARPTIAIPPAPLHPGYGYSGMSPAAWPGMPSPSYSASSGYSPVGSVVSTVGSGYSAGPPTANGGSFGTFHGAPADHAAALRSSTGSLPEMMPGLAAPTPTVHRLGDPSGTQNPFAGLAPSLRGTLPAMPNSGSSKYGAAAPPPNACWPAALPWGYASSTCSLPLCRCLGTLCSTTSASYGHGACHCCCNCHALWPYTLADRLQHERARSPQAPGIWQPFCMRRLTVAD